MILTVWAYTFRFAKRTPEKGSYESEWWVLLHYYCPRPPFWSLFCASWNHADTMVFLLHLLCLSKHTMIDTLLKDCYVMIHSSQNFDVIIMITCNCCNYQCIHYFFQWSCILAKVIPAINSQPQPSWQIPSHTIDVSSERWKGCSKKFGLSMQSIDQAFHNSWYSIPSTIGCCNKSGIRDNKFLFI